MNGKTVTVIHIQAVVVILAPIVLRLLVIRPTQVRIIITIQRMTRRIIREQVIRHRRLRQINAPKKIGLK